MYKHCKKTDMVSIKKTNVDAFLQGWAIGIAIIYSFLPPHTNKEV